MMKRITIGILMLAFAITGCKKAPKKKDKSDEPGTTMTAGMTMSAMRTAPPRRRPPARTAPKFKEFKPLAEMIKATKKCEKAVFFKCAEGKALASWTKDVWMNKIKLSDADKIRAWKTASSLALHPDKKVRNFAAGVFQLDPFGLRAKISKNPKLIHVRFVKNLLRALPTLETFRSGWLMSYIPHYAPAYGLLPDCFKAADKCKNKKDIYSRILKGFPKYSRLKHFAVSQKFAKDTSKENIKWATAALEGLMSFSWTKKDAAQVCYWLVALLPAKFEKDALKKTSGLDYYLYRYVDLATRCKVLDSEKHLVFIKKMKDNMKVLKGIKWDSKTYKKKIAELKDHLAKTAKKLKKAKKK
jgi:hypothetical protein